VWYLLHVYCGSSTTVFITVIYRAHEMLLWYECCLPIGMFACVCEQLSCNFVIVVTAHTINCKRTWTEAVVDGSWRRHAKQWMSLHRKILRRTFQGGLMFLLYYVLYVYKAYFIHLLLHNKCNTHAKKLYVKCIHMQTEQNKTMPAVNMEFILQKYSTNRRTDRQM